MGVRHGTLCVFTRLYGSVKDILHFSAVGSDVLVLPLVQMYAVSLALKLTTYAFCLVMGILQCYAIYRILEHQSLMTKLVHSRFNASCTLD